MMQNSRLLVLCHKHAGHRFNKVLSLIIKHHMQKKCRRYFKALMPVKYPIYIYIMLCSCMSIPQIHIKPKQFQHSPEQAFSWSVPAEKDGHTALISWICMWQNSLCMTECYVCLCVTAICGLRQWTSAYTSCHGQALVRQHCVTGSSTCWLKECQRVVCHKLWCVCQSGPVEISAWSVYVCCWPVPLWVSQPVCLPLSVYLLLPLQGMLRAASKSFPEGGRHTSLFFHSHIHINTLPLHIQIQAALSWCSHALHTPATYPARGCNIHNTKYACNAKIKKHKTQFF